MKVTIITICYNCEQTIERTIKSVLSQNYSQIEYIVIDGESTDKTLDIIKSYSNKISKIISEKDDGIYNAINKGLKIATGDIISLLHGNDVFAHERVINDVVNYFIEYHKVDLLITDVAFKKNFLADDTVRYYPSKLFKPWFLRFGYSPPHLSTFFSRKVINVVGLYDENFMIAGDFEYFVRCILINNLNFKLINRCYIFMSTGGLSNKSLKSYYISSKEINYALKKNNFYSNILITFLRFPLKFIQYIFK